MRQEGHAIQGGLAWVGRSRELEKGKKIWLDVG